MVYWAAVQMEPYAAKVDWLYARSLRWTANYWPLLTHMQMCGTERMRLVFIMRKTRDTETSRWRMGQESEASKVKKESCCLQGENVTELWNKINTLASVLYSGKNLKQPCSESAKMWEFLLKATEKKNSWVRLWECQSSVGSNRGKLNS